MVDKKVDLGTLLDIREVKGLVPLRFLPALVRGFLVLVPIDLNLDVYGHLKELGLADI